MNAQIQPVPLDPGPVMALVSSALVSAAELVAQAERAEIKDEASLAVATDFIKICAATEKKAETARKAQIEPLNNHVKWINEQWRTVTSKVSDAKNMVNSKATVYARKVEAEMRAKQAAEKKALEDAAMKAAEEAQAKGHTEVAELIVTAAANTRDLAPAVVKSRGSMTGASSGLRDIWRGTVPETEIRNVCAAIASGVLPAALVEFRQVELNRLAASLAKEGTHHGITITNDRKLVAR